MTLQTITAAELQTAQIPPPKQLVTGFLTSGLNIIAGAPKTGKSWLTLDVAIAVATGRKALGAWTTTQSDVLYLALEDTPYRLKSRLRALRQTHPENLHFATAAPRLMEGGLEAIDTWMNTHPQTGLIIIDTLAKIADAKTTNNIYDEDAATGTAIHAIAHHHDIAIVIIHHTRKQAHGDFLQAVSGSSGLTGTADTVAVLNRTRNDQIATLEITGRDILETTAKLNWNTTAAGWIADTKPKYNPL
jgi:RecA-family ATPase